jgi:RimJ/RimL family protein N-acetyltransferase
MQDPFLVGPSIYLRALRLEDAPLFVTWFNDAEVNRFTLRSQPLSLAEEEEFIRQLPSRPNDLVLGIVLRETDQMIGGTGFHALDQRNRHCSFGITLGEKSTWGRGYGTEATRLMLGHAFQTLNLNRVWLHVYEYNQRAIRSYEKAGFRIEGRLRQDTFRDGRYWDTVVMGILREEWRPDRGG